MASTDHPSSHAREVWKNHFANLAIERDRWRHAFFAALALSAVSICLSVWAAVQSRYVPYIVAVDELGRTRPIVAPREISDWPDVAVRHEIGAFLRDWRSVSTDRAVMEGRLKRVRFFLETNSAADRKIVAWATNPTTSPFNMSDSFTRDVEIVSVVVVGGRSWLAEWIETTRSRANGNVESVIRYQSTFVLGQRRVTEERILMQNPLGMVVEDYDLFKVNR